jgi:hypothetical protein
MVQQDCCGRHAVDIDRGYAASFDTRLCHVQVTQRTVAVEQLSSFTHRQPPADIHHKGWLTLGCLQSQQAATTA